MGTIAQKLANVATAKANIALAITNKGGEVPTAFIEYGDAINSIPTPAPPSGTKEISVTQNGTTTEDVVAYASAQISVSVPNTYAAGDEGKVVSSGELVAQTSRNIDQNGTYDTTTNNSVTVSVSGQPVASKLPEILSRQSSPTWTLSSNDLSGVTKIGDYAFYKCTGLTSVSVPEGVTQITTSGFAGCTGLTTMELPSTLRSVDNTAFNGCNSVTSVTFPQGNSWLILGTGCICSSSAVVVIYGNTIAVPDNVRYSISYEKYKNNTAIQSFSTGNGCTEVGESSFSGCTNLQQFTIGTSVTRLADKCFQGCTSLASITIPNSVTTINGEVFKNCSALASVTLPNNINRLSWDLFRNCTSLTSITVPDSVLQLGESWGYNTGTFSGCTSLAVIDFGTTRTTIPTLYSINNFADLPTGWEIWVPSDLLADWKAASNWSDASIVDHIVAHP